VRTDLGFRKLANAAAQELLFVRRAEVHRQFAYDEERETDVTITR
jgi:hypothetical protein